MDCHSLGPSDTFEYLFLNILASKQDISVFSISLFEGQISFKKTSCPSFPFPSGSLYKSKFIVPAIA